MTTSVAAFEQLHPAVQYHVVNSLGWTSLRPTQLQAIEPIQAGRHCLLLAPTAGGKTEAAFIPLLSRMVSEDWHGLSVLYICPIKALLNNLEPRLSRYAGLLGRTVGVWHGDVPDSRKRRILREPPDILLTTPESLEGMLVSPRIERSGWFAHLRVAIADELHALAADDRGWHLRSVLTRIDRYAPMPMQRIGLSATVGNPEELLAWFSSDPQRTVVGSSAVSTDAEVTIDAVGSLDNAATVISRLYRGEKRLVFCDSRASAERLGAALNQAGIRTFVSHASLSASERRHAEAAFAEERDCVIVATSTLELGIDVGDLDRVIQIDSPTSVGSFLQRMGRSGRRSGTRRNCLFLATSDQGLLNAVGICHLWSRAWVESATAPPEPWHVVAQQVLLTVLEHGEIPLATLAEAVQQSFFELGRDGVFNLLRHLVNHAYLTEEGNVIRIGPSSERAWGGGHYRDLMATFSGPDLLAARHGSSELGYLDPAVLSGQEGPQRVLLSGRSWLVREVDWKRRIAWLEPAKDGGKARWMGTSAEFSAELAEAIRRVLVDGEVADVKLSKRAAAALEELRESIPHTSQGVGYEEVGPDRFRAWTFAGTRSNRTAMLSRPDLGGYRLDGLGIDYRIDPRSASDTPAEQSIPDGALQDLVKLVKFGEALPTEMAVEMVRRRRLV